MSNELVQTLSLGLLVFALAAINHFMNKTLVRQNGVLSRMVLLVDILTQREARQHELIMHLEHVILAKEKDQSAGS